MSTALDRSHPAAASARRPTPLPVHPSRAGSDATVRGIARALLGGSLLLVTWWWAAGGGITDLTGIGNLGGPAAALTSLGRVTGLWASVLLLAQVVLMARVPILERAFGQDRLTQHHRVVGFSSFTLMLAHIVLITWGYAGASLVAIPRQLWTLTFDYPGMLLAFAGTAALVMVVVTSLRAARKRLRYESWHLLHLYAYLGVGLALPHQLWTGQQFLTSTASTIFWWSAWALAAGSILVWRVGLPLARSLRHRLRVTSVVPEGDGSVSVYLTGHHLDALRVEPGQFFLWRFLGRGWTRAHPYSLSAAPDGRSLRVTVKALGDGSAAVHGIRPGTRVLVEGPYGRLAPRARTRRKVALIGAGVGITPLRALAEGLHYHPGEAVLLHRYNDEPLFAPEFEVLARERGLRVLPLPGRRRADGSWLGRGVPAGTSDLGALRWWVPDIAERDVFLCGPERWAAMVTDTLSAAGVPASAIHVESFGW
ncbi:ferric reductase-like transmembrane domain-containing protein [Nocardioides taihuensis]|uniref:Ferric reductase-like transmembrane domain-containing protein n=1 Tax=Nocardioides taihuensis TaxID=1835606 RepID=A0ABW0BGC7_9ACTN